MKKEQEKYCFTTVVSDDFVYGFIVMLCSLREKNPWMNAPFYVFHHERECPLSEESMAEMRKYYDHIIFHRVDVEKFERILHARDNVIKTPARLASAFFILEAFTFSEYDRVICIDSDMLVLGDISELVAMETDFAAVPALHHITHQPYGFFNTGLMVIGRKYLSQDMLEAFGDSLKDFVYNPRHGAADQVLLNHFFRHRSVGEIAQKYNSSKRFYPMPKGVKDMQVGVKSIHRKLTEQGIVILHYVKEKPWNVKVEREELCYSCVEEFWHDAFERFATSGAKETFRKYALRQRNRAVEEIHQKQDLPLVKNLFRLFFPKHSRRRLLVMTSVRVVKGEHNYLAGLKLFINGILNFNKLPKIASGVDKGLNEEQVNARDVLRRYYLQSGAFDALKSKFENKYAGQRCFIIGNGPSLKGQDLTALKDEKVFCTNWFMNHEDYAGIAPDFHCLSSHEIFGGWKHENIQLNEDMQQALLEKTAGAIKFFSFSFRDYILDESPLAAHDCHYLLFDRPKQQVDQKGAVNLDLSRMMDDGYTGIITFCIPLAIFMGFKEIYLLGCDCDYGLDGGKADIKYFYDFSKHKTKTTNLDNLRRIWSYPNGAIFQSYRVMKEAAEQRGVNIINLTAGGRLEVFPRQQLADVIKRYEKVSA